MTTTDSLLVRCRQAMRSDEMTQARQQVSEALRTYPPFPPSDPVADAHHAVLNGKPVPDDLGQQLADRETRHHVWTQHRAGLHDLMQRLEADQRAHQKRSADLGLNVCRDDLERILTKAADPVAQLRGVTDAQQAIQADTVDAWRTASYLADAYTEVRHVQAVIVAQALTAIDLTPREGVPATIADLILTLGTVEDFSQRYPAGYVRPKPTPHGTSITQVDGIDPGTQLPWATGDPVRDLTWIVEHRDTVWLPTVNQLKTAKAHADKLAETAELQATFERGRQAQEAMKR